MKAFIIFGILNLLSFASFAQNETAKADTAKKTQIVEAACGECKFGLKGKSCDLAVRIDGHPYFVDGSGIDSHGDAHAKDGFCNAIRKAEVRGEIVDNRFKATYFKLIKTADTPEKKDIKSTKSKQG